MAVTRDGPASPHFTPLPLRGNVAFAELSTAGVSDVLVSHTGEAPTGSCVCWGIPFRVRRALLVKDRCVSRKLGPLRTPWLVFLHTADVAIAEPNADGFSPASTGRGRLNEHVADYVFVYADGSEVRQEIRRRHQIGMPAPGFGENCFRAVPTFKPRPVRAHHEQTHASWGHSQTRVSGGAVRAFGSWVWAWRNPHPNKAIVRLRVEPRAGVVLVSAITRGRVRSLPLRWEPRQKAVLRLPRGVLFDPALDGSGLLKQIQLDLGTVISAVPRALYPDDSWCETYNNREPELSEREVLVEYSAHFDARFHLPGGRTVPVAKLQEKKSAGPLRVVPSADRAVTLRAVVKGSKVPVPVKLHVHGTGGEYLAPMDRHRAPNPCWFEDYSVDYVHMGAHYCTYIPGETRIILPLGKVYVEVSKGFEIRPVRKVIRITRKTTEIVVEIEKVLPWRERGWVSADTHIHFVTPHSALLEGAGEGVNVVNLLATQLGELMTNVGDFDGRSTLGSREAGGDGEHLVRVGTENRQHTMGHISLLGYQGNVITPLTTAGPNESALGDAVEMLLGEWAQQCRDQGGVVVMPHFPNPRGEAAASIVNGVIDGVEQCSLGRGYNGIDPYSLSDWYRFLNCGYMTAAVGGTDKMSAATAVGTIRTYTHLDPNEEFTYAVWMDAIRRAETFVTYGPLMEFAVEGKPAGTRIHLPASGGTVDVTWETASVTIPMSRVELVVNGEIHESQAVAPEQAAGHWSLSLDRSSWLALLVRGHYPDRPEVIAAHSSPVMVEVDGSQFFAAADALTILEQIEGVVAYMDTVGTRAENRAYKRMRLVLTRAHRALHNRMHAAGSYHKHTPVNDHAAHRAP